MDIWTIRLVVTAIIGGLVVSLTHYITNPNIDFFNNRDFVLGQALVLGTTFFVGILIGTFVC